MSRNLIAILRGITPDEAEETTEALIEAGVDWLEVTMNSPQAFDSIELIAKRFGDDVRIGAGTVITAEEVARVNDVGGTFIVSPNCDQEVIEKTKGLGMGSYPGVFTPTECFAALKWGADALKLFPASMVGVSGVKAIQAVLPQSTQLFAVGGVDATNIGQWKVAGIDGFGIGSALYSAGKTSVAVGKSARQFIKAYDEAMRF